MLGRIHGTARCCSYGTSWYAYSRQHCGTCSRASHTTVAAAVAANQQEPVQKGAMADGGSKQRVRLAVVGDVHGQWGPADAAAVKALRADAVLVVGDIGNEDVALVQQLAAVGPDIQKAIILGNHDAWYNLTAKGRMRATQRQHSPTRSTSPPANQQSSSQLEQPRRPPHLQQQQLLQQATAGDRVQQQLDVLGDTHVGYGHKALQGTNISVVGARPFSKGGQDFASIADFMSRFGVSDMQQSAAKVVAVVNDQVPAGAVLLLLAHNGPTGLGAERHSICGCDWLSEAGDHGDPDLRMCLDQLHEAGRRVALVLHGHMHHMIKGGGWRQMVAIDPATGTLMLNAATVPRVVPLPHSNGAPAVAHRHHFLVVELQDGMPCCAADVWVQTQPNGSDTAAASSNSGVAAAQQHSFLAAAASAMHSVQHSKSKNKTQKQSAAAAMQAEVLRRVQLQAPQQLQLSRQELLVDQFRVQVAEVFEVLRLVQEDAAAVAAATAGNGSNAASGGAAAAAGPRWEFFDAHLGRWVLSKIARAPAQSSCKAASV